MTIFYVFSYDQEKELNDCSNYYIEIGENTEQNANTSLILSIYAQSV